MFGNRMKHCLVFASLISPSKMILFEKKYQTFDTVFHHQIKHLSQIRHRNALNEIVWEDALQGLGMAMSAVVSEKNRELLFVGNVFYKQ